jgi:indolepyruvate ferredoxin oxidoreductase
VPLSLQALMRAIELNAVSVEMNKAAFEWGRYAAQEPKAVADAMRSNEKVTETRPKSLDKLIDHRAALLVRYQDERYATRFRETIASLCGGGSNQNGTQEELSSSIVRSLFKLMAYKDEYEVARLYSEPGFKDALTQTFDGRYSLEFHLAPPLLSWIRSPGGEPRKITFGPWMLTFMKALARMKRLRGTPLDPFGYGKDRRLERQLIEDYIATMRRVIGRLTPANYAIALEIAELPLQIRGYGHVKERSARDARSREAVLLKALEKHISRGQGKETVAEPVVPAE